MTTASEQARKADSPRAQWSDYLDEAERNHAASASLRLVRDLAQNAGRSIRVSDRGAS